MNVETTFGGRVLYYRVFHFLFDQEATAVQAAGCAPVFLHVLMHFSINHIVLYNVA
jgi:hypothetical protein